VNRAIEFIKTTLLGGVLVIAPVAAIVFILAKVATILRHILEPVADKLPASIHFPYMTELVAVLVICFLAGLLIRTAAGRWVGGLIERHVFEKFPGYTLIKALMGRSLGGSMDQAAIPALAEMEEGLVPALIIERHHDGYVTVFVPSPPVPTVGQSYVFASSKVHPVDISLPKFVSCIAKWGVGAQEMRLAMRD
jgi:uncharacterized membrane protein